MYGLLVILIGYLFGCLHGSQIVGKLKNINLKQEGLKNAGASNATIVMGWKYGVIVGAIDIFKGTFSVLISLFILNAVGFDLDMLTFLLYINAFFVIIGHNYPFTMSFNGGKGTASLVGVMFALDWRIGLISLLFLIGITLITDYLIIGVMFSYLSFIITTCIFEMGIYPTIIASLLFILSIYKHLENFKRLSQKTEPTLSSIRKK